MPGEEQKIIEKLVVAALTYLIQRRILGPRGPRGLPGPGNQLVPYASKDTSLVKQIAEGLAVVGGVETGRRMATKGFSVLQSMLQKNPDLALALKDPKFSAALQKAVSQMTTKEALALIGFLFDLVPSLQLVKKTTVVVTTGAVVVGTAVLIQKVALPSIVEAVGDVIAAFDVKRKIANELHNDAMKSIELLRTDRYISSVEYKSYLEDLNNCKNVKQMRQLLEKLNKLYK